MKTLREVAEALCPIRLGEDYDKTIYNMIDEACHNEWIDGFITGAQWREDNPVAADSASDPESDSIELCGLLWDTENLAIGGPGRNGRHYAISARLGTMSLRAVGSEVTMIQTTRARCFCLLRASAILMTSAIAQSWPARVSPATIGPRRWTTKEATMRVAYI